MPLNYAEYEQSLNKCHEDLNQLFSNEKLKKHLKYVDEVKKYYANSYAKAREKATIEAIIYGYEQYIQHLTQLQNGSLTYKDYQKIEEKINNENDYRKLNVIFADLAKACELIFWASTALALYASVFLFALPMLIVQPVMGVAAGITIGGFLLKTALNCIQCLSEFRTFSRHNDVYVAQVSLLSIFKPESEPEPEPEQKAEESKEKPSGCFSFGLDCFMSN